MGYLLETSASAKVTDDIFIHHNFFPIYFLFNLGENVKSVQPHLVSQKGMVHISKSHILSNENIIPLINVKSDLLLKHV